MTQLGGTLRRLSEGAATAKPTVCGGLKYERRRTLWSREVKG
jgi:hypothetical protein